MLSLPRVSLGLEPSASNILTLSKSAVPATSSFAPGLADPIPTCSEPSTVIVLVASLFIAIASL